MKIARPASIKLERDAVELLDLRIVAVLAREVSEFLNVIMNSKETTSLLSRTYSTLDKADRSGANPGLFDSRHA